MRRGRSKVQGTDVPFCSGKWNDNDRTRNPFKPNLCWRHSWGRGSILTTVSLVSQYAWKLHVQKYLSLERGPYICPSLSWFKPHFFMIQECFMSLWEAWTEIIPGYHLQNWFVYTKTVPRCSQQRSHFDCSTMAAKRCVYFTQRSSSAAGCTQQDPLEDDGALWLAPFGGGELRFANMAKRWVL